jgi:hypothetical protein
VDVPRQANLLLECIGKWKTRRIPPADLLSWAICTVTCIGVAGWLHLRSRPGSPGYCRFIWPGPRKFKLSRKLERLLAEHDIDLVFIDGEP